MPPIPFPHDAFLPATGIKQRLAGAFNLRSYGAEDVRAVRTSVYYSNFNTKGDRLNYIASIGYGLRTDENRFSVYVSHIGVGDDRLRNTLLLSGKPSVEQEHSIECTQDDLIAAILRVDERLSANSRFGLAYPRDWVLNLRGDLHWQVAHHLFNRRMNADKIMSIQELVRDGYGHTPCPR